MVLANSHVSRPGNLDPIVGLTVCFCVITQSMGSFAHPGTFLYGENRPGTLPYIVLCRLQPTVQSTQITDVL